MYTWICSPMEFLLSKVAASKLLYLVLSTIHFGFAFMIHFILTVA